MLDCTVAGRSCETNIVEWGISSLAALACLLLSPGLACCAYQRRELSQINASLHKFMLRDQLTDCYGAIRRNTETHSQ